MSHLRRIGRPLAGGGSNNRGEMAPGEPSGQGTNELGLAGEVDGTVVHHVPHLQAAHVHLVEGGGLGLHIDAEAAVATAAHDVLVARVPTNPARFRPEGHTPRRHHSPRRQGGPDSAAEQGLQLGEHHLPRLAAKVGGAGRVRTLAHHEPGPTVVVVELQP
jgi:hypothetical protein